MTDRLILYPDLYASELKAYLADELPGLLHGYVRGRVFGASERLTKAKIREVVDALTSESALWWQQSDRNEVFFQRLQQTYPGCCNGKPPVINTTGKRQRVAQPSGSGCLVVVAAAVVACAVIKALAR